MGYFKGDKIPLHDPWWQERELMPEWEQWFNLGYEEGYAHGSQYREKLESLEQELEALRSLLAARAKWDKENLPDDSPEFMKEFLSKYGADTDTN